ncbi:MAG: hypothetical protein NXH83_00265 [Rhodobacteraceae bacterium]|nr:hypothetical protein [Paracoccaceae bacterium]
MLSATEAELTGRSSFLGRDITLRLADEGLEIRRGSEVSRVDYGRLAAIGLGARAPLRLALTISPADGTARTLRLRCTASSDAGARSFVRSLIARVAAVQPTMPVVLGPSRLQWLASWIGLLASAVILIVAAWATLTGAPLSAVLVPVSIAAVNLAVVVPILRAGPARTYTAEQAQHSLPMPGPG